MLYATQQIDVINSMRIILAITIFLFMLISFLSCTKLESNSQIQSDEYVIYSMLIEPRYPQNLPNQYKRNLTYVCDSTIIPTDLENFESYDGEKPIGVPLPILENDPKVKSIGVFSHFRDILPAHDWNTIERNFDNINLTKYKLNQTKIVSSIPVRLVGSSQFLDLWYSRTKEFDLVHFSRVGFDSTRTVAVVYAFWGYPGGCVMNYFILQHHDNNWVILRTIVALGL